MSSTDAPPSTASGRCDLYRGPEAPRTWLVAAAALAVTLVVTRVAGLSRSLWLDEAFTANRYVRDPSLILDADAFFANNHVLYTALTAGTSRLLGTSEVVLRLWAVVPGVVAALALCWWLWRRWSPAVAVAALAFITLSWVATQLHTEARGYGLVVAAGTVLLLVPSGTPRDLVRWRDDGAVALAGAVGLLTFPPFVMLYLAHAGTWLITRQVHRLRLVVVTAAVGLTSLAVLRPLLPVMFARADQVGSNRGEPIGLTSPIIGPLQLLAGESFGALLPGGATLPAMRAPSGSSAELVALVLALGLGAVGAIAAWRRGGDLRWHLLAGMFGSIVLLGGLGFHLLDRYVSFLLPHVAVVIGAGLVTLVALVVPPRRAAWRPAIVCGVVALAAVGALPHVWAQSTEPRQNFAEAARAIEATDPAVLVARELHVAWAWYLDRDAIERPADGAEADAAFCDGPRPAVYLPNPEREPEDGPSCLDEAELRELPERSDIGVTRWYVLR